MMQLPQIRSDAERAILAVLPVRAHDLSRLRVLTDLALAVVTVIGKYNHGRSRLLNELIGHAAFSVADTRETITLAEHVQADVCWWTRRVSTQMSNWQMTIRRCRPSGSLRT